ncbi:MAG: transposase [bacterium]
MENKPLRYRKHIRLKDYDYSSDGAYFITINANKKQLLINSKYKEIIETELEDLENRFSGVSLDYYVVMRDHIHFILILDNSEATIPRIMQAYKSLTTLKIKKAGYSGKRFWQPNYYEHIVRNEKALGRIRQYIVNNPLAEELNWREIEEQVTRLSVK